MPEDSDERYLAAMEPSVRILTELADSIRQLSTAMPDVETQGFAEILSDGALTSGQEGHTSATTHSLSGLALMGVPNGSHIYSTRMPAAFSRVTAGTRRRRLAATTITTMVARKMSTP